MRKRWAAALLALAVTANLALAHYHFVHFASRNAPFQPIRERFDLNSLTDRKLPYFVAEPNGVQLAPNDSFAALISQIRAAAKVWSDVETSELRLAFGGVVPAGTPQPGPSMEFVFEEVPPGIVAAGSPVTRSEMKDGFVPIVKSVVILQPDLRNRPSYSEALFGTLVHEIGHALGLQHTFTSGAMSTATTRSTTKGRPLTPDDVAGISLLYPRGDFSLVTGSISGRVTMNGNGVNLASVVAIAPNGTAISTLTNPDGTYRIDGIPPRAYLVYVHPLPPPLLGQPAPGDVIAPVDNEARPFPASSPFETIFFGGVREPAAAIAVPVTAGTVTPNINFAVRARTGYTVHSVETYGFPGNLAVKPPYVSPGLLNPFLVANGGNLVRSNAPVPGLTATVLGGAALNVKPYAPAASAYVQLDMDAGTLLVPSESPRHLVFATGTDIYVLPAAFYHVSRQPPFISAVIPGFEGTTRILTLTGNNFTPETRILFDGVQATVRNLDDQGRLVVVPPPAAPGHRAVLTAVNPDGQSSLFLQADNPPSYTYPGEFAGSAVLLQPNALAPGMEAMLTLEGVNTNFTEGQLTIGFGTTDVTVRRVVVQSPTRALVNVVVSAMAQPGQLNVTIVSGLNVIQQPFAFQIQAPQPRAFWLSSLTLNVTTGQAPLTPGSTAMMLVPASPAPLTPTTTTVLLGETRVPLQAVQGWPMQQITFQVPSNLPAGPVVVRVEAAGERSLPILVQIDPVPRPEGPRIAAIVTVSSSQARLLKAGEIASLLVADAPRGAAAKISVTLGSRDLKVLQVFEENDRYNVFIQVPEDAQTGENIALVVSVDGRASEPVSLTITK